MNESPYYVDEDVRNKINNLLHRLAILESSLGKDSTVKEIVRVKVLQEKVLDGIKQLDPEYYLVIKPAI